MPRRGTWYGGRSATAGVQGGKVMPSCCCLRAADRWMSCRQGSSVRVAWGCTTLKEVLRKHFTAQHKANRPQFKALPQFPHFTIAQPATLTASKHALARHHRTARHWASFWAAPIELSVAECSGVCCAGCASAVLCVALPTSCPPPCAPTCARLTLPAGPTQLLGMKPCNLSADALYTILLHAAKHPTSAVSGLLLGSIGGDAVDVAQALPVCHSFIMLTPLLEAAMVQVRGAGQQTGRARPPRLGAHCTPPSRGAPPTRRPAPLQAEQYAKEQQPSRSGLRLVGYYQCNERLADGELGAGRRVADRLEAACPDAVALVVRQGRCWCCTLCRPQW